MDQQLDVLIIGSGPAGLGAAVYAKRAGLRALVMEKEYRGTGQITESDQVDNYLGFSKINGYDLGEAFLKHAEELDVQFQEGAADAFSKNDISRGGRIPAPIHSFKN